MNEGQLKRRLAQNSVQAKSVLRELASKVRNPQEMKAIGFCVSVEHAKFMRDVFQEHGLPAEVLGETKDRKRHISALMRGELRCLFVHTKGKIRTPIVAIRNQIRHG